MSQHGAGSTPRSPFTMSLATLRRGGFVVAAAALALTVPGTIAEAQPAPSMAASTAVVTIVPQVTIAPSNLVSTIGKPAYEHRLKVWMNRQRARIGVRSVGVRPCIDTFADRWTHHLVATDGFYHQDLGGVMRTCRQSQAGEILAMGNVTPYQMVRLWMASPDHRRLLLSNDYARAGISARRDTSGNWIGCIDFGRR